MEWSVWSSFGGGGPWVRVRVRQLKYIYWHKGEIWSTSNASFLLSEGSYQVQECVCAFGFEL